MTGLPTGVRTRIKFCGFCREQDIDEAVALGIDAIGLIVVPASPRALTVERAAVLRRRIPPFVHAVLLVKDPDAHWLSAACALIAPDILQFHGDESAELCRRAGMRYLKAVPMAGSDVDQAAARAVLDAHRGAASGWVLDSHRSGGLGGSGRTFDWTRVPELDLPLVLAGGLNADNVTEAIQRVRPYAVDVAGGIESAPGIKDAHRMVQFVRAVREADRLHADETLSRTGQAGASSMRARPAGGDPLDAGVRNIDLLKQAGTT